MATACSSGPDASSVPAGSSRARFQRSGDAVRVTALVTDVTTGQLTGTSKVDGRLHAIFELQDGLVHELGRTILAAVEPDTDAGTPGNQRRRGVRGVLARPPQSQRGDVRVARSRGVVVRARCRARPVVLACTRRAWRRLLDEGRLPLAARAAWSRDLDAAPRDRVASGFGASVARARLAC